MIGWKSALYRGAVKLFSGYSLLSLFLLQAFPLFHKAGPKQCLGLAVVFGCLCLRANKARGIGIQLCRTKTVCFRAVFGL